MLKKLTEAAGITSPKKKASSKDTKEKDTSTPQEKLNSITPKLLKLNKRLLDLLANPAFPNDEYDPADIRIVLGELATKSEQLVALISQIPTSTDSFIKAYDDLFEIVGTLNEEVDQIEALMQTKQKLADLIREIAVSKNLWEALLANQFFPATTPKEPILEQIAKLEAGIDSLIGGNPDPTYEQVKSALNASIKHRASVEHLVTEAVEKATRAQKTLVTSQQGTSAITGAGSLATVVTVPTTDKPTTKDTQSPNLSAS